MTPTYRQPEPKGNERADRSVQSVSISRREASRTSRYGKGGKRTVTRGRRQFEAAVAQFEVTERLRNASLWPFVLRGTPWHPAKIVSIVIVLAAMSAVAAIHNSEAWYVYAEDVEIRNLTYLDSSEIVQQSEIEGWHTLWLTADNVKERLMANPYIADAYVRIGLPARLTVAVEEVQPIALWVTNDTTYWLAPDGTALPAIASTAEGLPQLVDALGEAKAITRGPTLAVDEGVLASALELMNKMPELDNKIRFHRDIGLNFPLPGRDIWVYWGDGENTESKLANLRAAESLLDKLEEPVTYVDVRFLNRPYLR